MAFGNTTQNNKTNNAPTYYSRLRIANPTDSLNLSFTYWNGTIKLAISEFSQDRVGSGNRDDLATIYFSPTKSRMFAKCIKSVLDNPNTKDIFAVDTGAGEKRGFIAIGRDNGKPFIFVARVDADGNYESSQRFNFNWDYSYTLKVSDLKKLKCQKIYDNNLELEQAYNLFNDYANAMSGAYAYATHDLGRYENYKSHNILSAIADKVGAEYGKSGNGNYRSNNNRGGSYFDNNGSQDTGSGTKYQSIDDLEEEFDIN